MNDHPPTRQEILAGSTLAIDKPLDWTSFDVVNKIKAKCKFALQAPKLKIGHAGTLDPKATGLLVVCTGIFTKKIDEIQAQQKEYTGIIVVGATRPSFDMETEIEAVFPTEHINEAKIEQARQQFLGEIEQVPPMFSAIKVDGQRAYDLARRGETVAIPTRKVTIYELELDGSDLPNIWFRAVTSKGTYIRALANDLGVALGSGAYLGSLRRTKIGHFDAAKAWQIDDLMAYLDTLRE